MGWASVYIEKLQAGETVELRPKGNSMQGKVESGQLCVVEPVKTFEIGDIVLCKVKGREYLHLIKAIKNDRYQSETTKAALTVGLGKILFMDD